MNAKPLLWPLAVALLSFSFSNLSPAESPAENTSPAASPESSPSQAAEEPVSGTPTTPPADKSKFQIILLIGQSNMAGRGATTHDDRQPAPNVLVLNRLDQWYSQGEPIHFDKPKSAGVGPGFTFGKLLAAKEPGITVGLVPCAFGGTSIEEWDPTAGKQYYPPYNLYNNAIRRAKIAMKSGTLAGILWHQGEGNANADAGKYAEKLAKLVAQIRKDLDAPDVPFVAGELGPFLCERKPAAITINQQIDSLPKLVSKSGVATSEGLKDRGDRLHFDTPSQKELASRYLDTFLKIQQGSGTQAH